MGKPENSLQNGSRRKSSIFWVQIKQQPILHWLKCTYTNKLSQIDLKFPFFLEKYKLANTEAVNKKTLYKQTQSDPYMKYIIEKM